MHDVISRASGPRGASNGEVSCEEMGLLSQIKNAGSNAVDGLHAERVVAPSPASPGRAGADANVLHNALPVKVVHPGMVSKWNKAKRRNFSASRLRRSRGVYNWRPASAHVVACMLSFVQCVSVCAQVPLMGKSSVAIRAELRDRLSASLSSHAGEKAFEKCCGFASCPRVDDLEGMVRAFPGKDQVDWNAEPVNSGINSALWRTHHARHCASCTATKIHEDCYFKLLHHWLSCGFDPPEAPDFDVFKAQAPVRAYVDNWMEEEERCNIAFEKWKKDTSGLMSNPVDKAPPIFFPLLPVVREKDKWKKDKYGTEYKVRLCLDFKMGGYNDMLLDWPFRYWNLDCVAENVKRGDWLGTLDISRFYLRLPAGAKLRQAQWFQDPASYGPNTHDNDRMSAHKLRFRNLLSVAFGLKSAPAYASVVSMEAVRILRSFGVDVAGVYLDDLLIRGATEEECRRNMALAETVLAALGIPTNDKAQGPCSPSEGVDFLGVHICTQDCSMVPTVQYRLYAAERVEEILRQKSVSLKRLESVAGSLAWISQVFLPGRPRRHAIYRALSRMQADGKPNTLMAGELKMQLQWWLRTLRAQHLRPSSFFWDMQPDTPLMCSDASGDDGWGACVMGLHIVGPWPKGYRQSDGADAPGMLLKELIPPVVATLLLGQWCPNVVFAAATDNAGVAFVLNSLSCAGPQCLALLQPLADSLAAHHLGLLAGHAHRVHNQHCDDLSHALSSAMWNQVLAGQHVHKPSRLELPFIVHDMQSGECFAATMSFARPSRRGVKHASP